jgi:hypothetical protein
MIDERRVSGDGADVRDVPAPQLNGVTGGMRRTRLASRREWDDVFRDAFSL